MDQTAQYVKVCSWCEVPKPLEEFRPRYAGSDLRHSWCGSCHAAGERRRRAGRRQKTTSSLAGSLVRAKDRDEAVRVCKVAMAAFGGTLGVARAFWECHRSAVPGSPTAARILLALLRLEELTARARSGYAMMDDEDLNERVAMLRRKVMAKAAAEAVGGT